MIAVYKKALDAAWQGLIDVETDALKLVLVDYAAYTLDLAVDEFLSDIPGGAQIAHTATLTGVDIALGILDADDTQFTAVGAGNVCEAFVMYQDTGVAATSRLLFVFDNSAPAVSGLPVTSDGGDIDVTWDDGANKIVNLDS